MIKTITIPENVRDIVQRANVERDARRDIILYIMENNVNISEERFKQYQNDYDEKYLAFETAKLLIEKNYVKTVAPNVLNWSLDYSSCIVSIVLPDE